MSRSSALPRPKVKWHNFFLVCMLGIASGIFLGSWYSYSQITSVVDYSSYTEADLRDSIEDVIKDVLNIDKPTTDQINNWLTLAKQKGIKPTDLLPSQNFILAEYNASKAESYSAIANGMVETIASQTIRSEKYFDGTAYTSSSISKGILTVAELSYMKKDSGTIKTIKGNNVTSTSANWNGAEKTLSNNEYLEQVGLLPNALNPYIVSSKTILANRAEDIVKTTYNNKEVYKFTFQLDAVTSVLNYIKQVKYTSGLSDYPSFDDITQTVYIDEDWNFVRIEIVENYRVTFSGLKPKCKGTLNTDYTFNQSVTLPVNKD